MRNRLEDVRKLTLSRGFDAAVIRHAPHVRWASGFTGSNGLLFISSTDAHFFTDGRYAEQAAREVDGGEVHAGSGSLIQNLGRNFGQFGGRIVVDDATLTVAEYTDLEIALGSAALVRETAWLAEVIATKTPDEIERLRDAQALNDRVFSQILELVRAGRTEKEIAADVACMHYREGAERLSFDPIVASGSNGALPHAKPTDRPLSDGDLVIIDMGSFVGGYASDMTRTVAVGQPAAEVVETYEAVLSAQKAALTAARAGISTREFDSVARDVLAERGLGDAFQHGLGHGIGLEVHEWPRLSQHTSDTLPVNCAVTVEPGVYIPSRFGVRIEDTIVLTESGHLNLTTSPKDLIVL